MNEGWIKTYQTFHNNSVEWWVNKFEKKFSKVQVIDSSWKIIFQLENGLYVINNICLNLSVKYLIF